MRAGIVVVLLLLGTRAVGGDLSPVALGRIDAHAHVFAEAKPVLALLDRLNVTAVNVCVVDRYDRGYETVAPQHAMARRLVELSRGRLPWIATFDDAGFAGPAFAATTLAGLDQALAEGAIGVKVYKSMGMELRSASGAYVLPDDPAFEPVFAGLEARGTTVYGHIAEPIAAWLPLDPSNPDYEYYRSNPAWHVHGRPGMPTKAEVLAARDRVLEKHPRLRFVGCHLGSMEEDVDEIAKRFEREYARDWAYFATGQTIDVAGRKVPGLALPEPVLRRIFRDNALRWVPGLAAPR